MTTSAAWHGNDPAVGLRTTQHDGVVIATLDRPPANALDRSLLLALTAFLNKIGERAPKPVLLTGGGERFFCAGGDITASDGPTAESIGQRMQAFHDLLVAMERYPAPIIAAVNGICVGGGLEIALFADAVLAVPHARFGFPEIRHGLLPADKGIERVIRLIGMRAARTLLLDGELVDADDATRIGLVDGIVAPDRLMADALGRAQEAGRRAPVLYSAIKQALNDQRASNDDRRAGSMLAKAARWIEDPVARSLRDGWRADRAAKRPADGH